MPGNVRGAEPDQLSPTTHEDTPPTANLPEDNAAMGEWAAHYARSGALVFPLHTPAAGRCSCRKPGCPDVGKHPRTLHGLTDATADADQVRLWWQMWPEANIGIRPQVGQVVVDVDPRNGGSDQLRAMQATYGPLTPSLSARTGGGGWHIWYVHHGAHVAKLAPGVDVKGHSGYVVAPPSLHASGKRYRWHVQGPIAAPPEYLPGLLTPVRAAPRDTSGTMTDARMAGLVRIILTATPGQNRNQRLYWAARRVAEVGADPNPLIEAVLTMGTSREEAEKTIASAFGGAM